MRAATWRRTRHKKKQRFDRRVRDAMRKLRARAEAQAEYLPDLDPARCGGCDIPIGQGHTEDCPTLWPWRTRYPSTEGDDYYDE